MDKGVKNMLRDVCRILHASNAPAQIRIKRVLGIIEPIPEGDPTGSLQSYAENSVFNWPVVDDK